MQAQAAPNSGGINLEEATRTLAHEGDVDDDIKGYKAAVKAYAAYRRPCDHVPNAPIGIATRLRKYTKCERAQEPALAAATQLLVDWESHQAEARRSRAGIRDAESAWIRTLIAAAPHITAWNKAVARYQAAKC
jgi:hypothetical protein